MHSFQPSRGRILLEVFCALAMVASMVGAWRQTHASALLVAAGAAGLLAMIRLFDLGRPRPAAVEEPQRIEFEPEAEGDLQADMAVEIPPAAVEPLPSEEAAIHVVASAEPRSSAGRRKGGSRKGSGRRAASASKAAEVVEFAPPEEAETAVPEEVADPAPTAVPEVADVSPADEAYADLEEAVDEPAHVPHAPLFEPEPFVRMQRQAFGRRGRL